MGFEDARSHISIHTLRMEGDANKLDNDELLIFQSTPSAWRVTLSLLRYDYQGNISIHTLRMEGDHIINFSFHRQSDFNPHPPHGG